MSWPFLPGLGIVSILLLYLFRAVVLEQNRVEETHYTYLLKPF